MVEISPKANPPVCKVIDYGKYKYQAQKRANEAKKKQKNIDVKEIKFRPNIDTHDYNVKIKVETDEFAKVELLPKFEGRQMVMVLAPK